MHPAGLAKIDQAQQDGSWSKLDSVEELKIPDDLRVCFDQFPGSDAFFEAFPRSVKRGILEWIEQAKRPATRAARIEQTARMAQNNERANQWKDRRSD